jgi:hypothetical protein
MGKHYRRPKAVSEKVRDRPIRLYVSLNQAEYDQIVEESRKAGVCYAAYVRAMTFKGQLITRLTEEDKVLFREMVRISNALSQLITVAREQGLEEGLTFFRSFRDGVDNLLNRIKL